MQAIVRFFKGEEGATAMEYGLILGLAAAVIFLGITLFYQGLNELFAEWGQFFSNRAAQVQD
jgi:Flp pilus assembly pilin Flp